MSHFGFLSLMIRGLGLSSPLGQTLSHRPNVLHENTVFPAIFSVLLSDNGEFDRMSSQPRMPPSFSVPLLDNLSLAIRQCTRLVRDFAGFSLFVSRTKPFWIADFRFPISET